jgi:hypothetical protein
MFVTPAEATKLKEQVSELDTLRPHLALNGHFDCATQCPLLGIKRTPRRLVGKSANDPLRTCR